MHNKIIDFENELGSLPNAKSIASDKGKELIQTAIAQSGLPPETFDFATKIFSGKGSFDDKLQAVTKSAQNMVLVALGPGAQIGVAMSAPIMGALGIEPSAAANVASGVGASLGTALAGPLGGAVGGFIANTIVGGIADMLTTSPNEREAHRRKNSLVRINMFAKGQGLTPLDSSHHWTKELSKWYKLFRAGKIAISTGQPGKQNTYYRISQRDGKLKKINPWKGMDRELFYKASPNYLSITSSSMSGRFLAAITPIEAKAVLIKRATEALLAAKQNQTETVRTIKSAVTSAINKSNIDETLDAIIHKQRGMENKLERYARLLAVADKRNDARVKAHDVKARRGQITLGKLITHGAVLSKLNNEALSDLRKSFGKSVIVPDKYANVLGGRGLINLIKKHG